MPNQNQELKKAGLKITAPRVRILHILEDSRQEQIHMSAESVYKKLLEDEDHDSVGLATVYRVLTQFETAGLVDKHHFEGAHAVYEIKQDEHHDHMVCVESGEVTEFFDSEIEKLQHEIAKRHGYELVDHNLVLYVKKT